jgi:hypothetical protein
MRPAADEVGGADAMHPRMHQRMRLRRRRRMHETASIT